MGKHTERQPIYQLEQLLDDTFKLPRPPSKTQKRQRGVMGLMALASDPRNSIKLWRGIEPGKKVA